MNWFPVSWISQEKAQTLAGMFSMRREDHAEQVQPGVTFRRVHPDHLIETAEVLSVSEDRNGIAHVQYQVRFQRTNRSVFEESQRMLALSSFADRYRERMPT